MMTNPRQRRFISPSYPHLLDGNPPYGWSIANLYLDKLQFKAKLFTLQLLLHIFCSQRLHALAFKRSLESCLASLLLVLML